MARTDKYLDEKGTQLIVNKIKTVQKTTEDLLSRNHFDMLSGPDFSNTKLETGKIYGITNEQTANLHDILMVKSDNTDYKFVDSATAKTLYNSGWQPLGIVVIPSSHNRYGDGTPGVAAFASSSFTSQRASTWTPSKFFVHKYKISSDELSEDSFERGYFPVGGDLSFKGDGFDYTPTELSMKGFTPYSKGADSLENGIKNVAGIKKYQIPVSLIPYAETMDELGDDMKYGVLQDQSYKCTTDNSIYQLNSYGGGIDWNGKLNEVGARIGDLNIWWTLWSQLRNRMTQWKKDGFDISEEVIWTDSLTGDHGNYYAWTINMATGEIRLKSTLNDTATVRCITWSSTAPDDGTLYAMWNNKSATYYSSYPEGHTGMLMGYIGEAWGLHFYIILNVYQSDVPLITADDYIDSFYSHDGSEVLSFNASLPGYKTYIELDRLEWTNELTGDLHYCLDNDSLFMKSSDGSTGVPTALACYIGENRVLNVIDSPFTAGDEKNPMFTINDDSFVFRGTEVISYVPTKDISGISEDCWYIPSMYELLYFANRYNAIKSFVENNSLGLSRYDFGFDLSTNEGYIWLYKSNPANFTGVIDNDGALPNPSVTIPFINIAKLHEKIYGEH
jgi:hypothetical protein